MIEPLFDNVLVEPKEADTKTPSGLFVPETAQPKHRIGVVRAVGPKCDEVMVLDEVLFRAEDGFEVEHRGKTYLLLEETAILALIRD